MSDMSRISSLCRYFYASATLRVLTFMISSISASEQSLPRTSRKLSFETVKPNNSNRGKMRKDGMQTNKECLAAAVFSRTVSGVVTDEREKKQKQGGERKNGPCIRSK
jgi:hypothetical protein